MNEAAAIEIIKNKFPELKNYPSNQQPQKIVTTEKANDGWYIAFIQEGSGRPIISAQCFFVSNDNNIVKIATFDPPINDPARTISPKTCRAATPNDTSLNLPNGYIELIEQIDIIPKPGNLYVLAGNSLYETKDPGPSAIGTSIAWGLANEFVYRTGLRNVYKLPAQSVRSTQQADWYEVEFESQNGDKTIRIQVDVQSRTLELIE